MKAFLVLEDGTVYKGEAFGASDFTRGEVVFNTGMTGYQEILTDPSYAGQIVVMTYPLIGNYGINDDDSQSDGPRVRGFVVKKVEDKPVNFRSCMTLGDYLKAHCVSGISGIDTRSLVKKIRSSGTMKGFITTDIKDINEQRIKDLFLEGEVELLKEVSVKKPYTIEGKGKRVAVIDLGIKRNILKCFSHFDFQISVFPYNATASQVMESKPDALFLSNGPGDPKDAVEAISLVAELKRQIPILGICLGHQVISLALGADTYKLKYGHRGSNHPVKDLRSGKIYITSQNHGYAVDEKSLGDDVEVTHINLNDNTVEGIRHKYLPIFSVQYHPEASPGPGDSMYLFEEFMRYIA
ncbi:glutamine-hydrolyzing carbamoyl-phosphate synthase small subunit [Calorimonas adulescens]|jgi:carbamoyl-phosphate synthase small subunit|uniref:Carbamoyl phosphate synthase small chain n=1 Tax=Calorimonas adulescens TaxID=2606906 RepID=A0A5D8QGK1_9THEO|nr:glutamine-hydrolyzing carbamoyl-phosphate synthase small subunit [Calorimonas adulescens]TZE83621.1 glutamine-hydrolyzing carbamoyl-phosphate synthase small subunit [Calorimonas adulescens]